MKRRGASEAEERIRLDQWLWAARFFKTRTLAKQAVENGRVHIEGQKAKPSRDMRIGMIIQIRQGWEEKTVVVTGLSAKRGSATIAATLYQETRESLEARERQANERKLSGISRIISENRPDKKSRRQIHRFLRQHDQEQ